MWGAGKGWPGGRDIIAEPGGSFLSQEAQGETSGEVKQPLVQEPGLGGRPGAPGGSLHTAAGKRPSCGGCGDGGTE